MSMTLTEYLLDLRQVIDQNIAEVHKDLEGKYPGEALLLEHELARLQMARTNVTDHLEFLARNGEE